MIQKTKLDWPGILSQPKCYEQEGPEFSNPHFRIFPDRSLSAKFTDLNVRTESDPFTNATALIYNKKQS